ncbi:MAG: hypothetical protein WKG32_14805 [Gemmatimonadaceae bacterium]
MNAAFGDRPVPPARDFAPDFAAARFCPPDAIEPRLPLPLLADFDAEAFLALPLPPPREELFAPVLLDPPLFFEVAIDSLSRRVWEARAA